MSAADGSFPLVFCLVVLVVGWALWQRKIALAVLLVCGAYGASQADLYRMPLPETLRTQLESARSSVFGKQRELVCDSNGLAGLGKRPPSPEQLAKRRAECGDRIDDSRGLTGQ